MCFPAPPLLFAAFHLSNMTTPLMTIFNMQRHIKCCHQIFVIYSKKYVFIVYYAYAHADFLSV